MNKQLLVNSKDKTKFYLVDVNDRRCYVVDRHECKIEKYNDNEVKIADSYGTLAYINKEYNVYGILRERRSGVGILWIKIEDAKIDDKFNDLINNTEELTDITEFGIDAFSSTWCPKLEKPTLVKNIKGTLMNRENFLLNIGAIVKEESIEEQLESTFNRENSTNIDNYSEEGNKLESCVNIKESLDIYMKGLEDRLKEITLREDAVAKKEAELIEKSNKLNRLLAEYDGVELNRFCESMVDVDLIVDNGNIQETTNTENDNTYELILKTLKKNDCITLPKEYYNKLKINIKKNLEANSSYTKYKALVIIKFNVALKENLIGVVDIDESKSNFTLTVIKEYGLNTLDNNEVVNYALQYTKWRKQAMSFD